MTKLERRNAVALDDAYFYCRILETKSERPTLYKVCNAIRTLDLALAMHDEPPMPLNICAEAWSRVRDSLFNILISSFQGNFFVYTDEDSGPVDQDSPRPEQGYVTFYPAKSNRKNDSYTSRTERIDPSVLTTLRWLFAEGRNAVEPADFAQEPGVEPEDVEDIEKARELLIKLYAVCEEEASVGKKKAHRRWWQLYWEADACEDKRERHQLRKQMLALQTIWGRPE
jgi:hypothetical protein